MENTEVADELRKYYRDRIVTSIVGIVADVNKVEAVSKSLAGNNNIEDIYVVTGEFDIIIKVRFPDLWTLQEFLVDELSKIPGVKNSKTMMVLSAVKDMGHLVMG